MKKTFSFVFILIALISCNKEAKPWKKLTKEEINEILNHDRSTLIDATLYDSISRTQRGPFPMSLEEAKSSIRSFYGTLALHPEEAKKLPQSSYVFNYETIDKIAKKYKDSLSLEPKDLSIRVYPALAKGGNMTFIIVFENKRDSTLIINRNVSESIPQMEIEDNIGPCPPKTNCPQKDSDLFKIDEWKDLYKLIQREDEWLFKDTKTKIKK
ncbi:hypothetical protein EMA8858_00210 [Emticicia aquatica]|jgi:hypothetical protein|uniref:Lipoprotein n=1 Tax=Emticicia aquatica TaxID=1681835 RepID=A0ABN8EQS8_9BACT|nr:hypothetical protein [Emticicia aquatica]CAH0994103.1 hypothetical protein EMA8858_00210 [Emticicia aquatica]